MQKKETVRAFRFEMKSWEEGRLNLYWEGEWNDKWKISKLEFWDVKKHLGFVRKFGGEGKGRLWRVRNIGENDKIFHNFLKSNFLEYDKLMFMIN